MVQLKFALAVTTALGAVGGLYGACVGTLVHTMHNQSPLRQLLFTLNSQQTAIVEPECADYAIQCALITGGYGAASGLAAYGLFSGSRYLYQRINIQDEVPDDENAPPGPQ